MQKILDYLQNGTYANNIMAKKLLSDWIFKQSVITGIQLLSKTFVEKEIDIIDVGGEIELPIAKNIFEQTCDNFDYQMSTPCIQSYSVLTEMVDLGDDGKMSLTEFTNEFPETACELFIYMEEISN